jgi:hypothetical protein
MLYFAEMVWVLSSSSMRVGEEGSSNGDEDDSGDEDSGDKDSGDEAAYLQ